MPSLKVLKTNWLGLLGLLIGLAGVLLTIYSYVDTLESRDPVFVVDENRTEIIQGERVATAPLRVTKADGTAITGDITAVRMYFWNQGRLPIREEHILEPLHISVNDRNAEILDFKILGSSRDVVQPQVLRSEGDPEQSLDLDFRILELNDGFTLQVIYVGAPSAQFELTGTIEGVPHAIGSESIEQSRFWSVILAQLSGFGLLILMFVVVVGVPTAIFAAYQRLEGRIPAGFSKTLRVAKIGVVGFFVIFFPLLVVWGLINESRDKARKSLAQSVPAAILKPLSEQPMSIKGDEATTNSAADAPSGASNH